MAVGVRIIGTRREHEWRSESPIVMSGRWQIFSVGHFFPFLDDIECGGVAAVVEDGCASQGPRGLVRGDAGTVERCGWISGGSCGGCFFARSMDGLIDWLIDGFSTGAYSACIYGLSGLAFAADILLYPEFFPGFLGWFFVLQFSLSFGNDRLIDWSIVSISFAYVTYVFVGNTDRSFLVVFVADERDAIQKKTFTKWVNKHLKKVSARCVCQGLCLSTPERTGKDVREARPWILFSLLRSLVCLSFFLLLSRRCLGLFVVAHITWDSLVIFICFVDRNSIQIWMKNFSYNEKQYLVKSISAFFREQSISRIIILLRELYIFYYILKYSNPSSFDWLIDSSIFIHWWNGGDVLFLRNTEVRFFSPFFLLYLCCICFIDIFLFFPSFYPEILALEIYSGAYSVMGWHNFPLGLPTCVIPSCFITFLYIKYLSIPKSHGFSWYSPQKHACDRNKSHSRNSDITIPSSFLRNFRVERTRSFSSGGNFIHSSIYRHVCMGKDQGLPWVVVCSSPPSPVWSI